jgi:DNA-binding CsgD family transcriptional regulator
MIETSDMERTTALTPQESRVAKLAAAGFRNREIAERLGLSAKTVEWTLTRVYRKLGLRSRTELALRDADARAAGENPWDERPEQ